jgi:phosphoglucosamine mutase
MISDKFEQIIIKNADLLKSLYNNKIFFISDLTSGGLLQNTDILTENASFFDDEDQNCFSKLITSDFLQNYSFPALFDFKKTVELYKGSSLPDDERIASAFTMSRVNFLGTDGIRGKVVFKIKNDPLIDLVANNSFSPQLVELCSFSFASMLMENDVIKKSDTVVIGDDGRDIATEWKLKNAVIDGFIKSGLNIYDLGIVPTAIVPFQILKKDMRAGAVLTASHNPSNQNGIKFFLDGKKLLPEGEFGDYMLSAYMYHYCTQPIPAQKRGEVVTATNVTDESESLIYSILPDNTSEILKGVTLVFDSANGAFDTIGRKTLDSLDIPYTSVNEAPTGVNINKNCGVAEIEGTELFEGSGYDGHVPFVKELFDKGRSIETGDVFGMALDGDGDRCFLLCFDKERDCIHVIDGDKCGYILSEYFINKRELDPKDYYFVSTIESDLMTASSAQNNLGLNTKIVSVGDKWIGNFTGGELLVGLEISGHIIFPVKVVSESGKEKTLLTGNGLLTGLLSLVAIKELGLPPEKIVEPFEPGMSKTSYVFIVDKSRFYRNSTVWIQDRELLTNEISRLTNEGKLTDETKLEFENKEDLNVLYANIVTEDGVAGCIFTRNSGTEDKNAIYMQGKEELKDTLLYLGKKIQDHHTEVMKNRDKIEFLYETVILSQLKEKKEVSFTEVKSSVENELSCEVNEGDLFSVVYGLKKEGRISFENEVIKLI